MTASEVGSRSGETAGQVRHDFQVALRGWADDEMDDADLRDVTPRQHVSDARAVALSQHREARRAEVDTTITTVLDLLEVDDHEPEAVRLEALVAGVTIAVCTGRITPDQALATIDRHLAELGPGPARVAE